MRMHTRQGGSAHWVSLALCASAIGGGACRSDFERHRARYEAVVAKARAMDLSPGGRVARWRGDWEFDPVALPQWTNLCALRTKDNHLVVQIVAYDRHHGGWTGYVYSDVALEISQLRRVTDGCREWETGERIGAHWTAIESHLQ